MARNILNIDSGLRQINPRSGSSVYVDLVSDQSISGIKTFLSNLITNSNVNFKNASNQDCLIITPLLSALTYRLQLFGTAGGIKKLYYNISDELGLIELTTTIWKINGAGAITCTSVNAGSGNITTTGSISGGSISATTSFTANLINASTGSNKIHLDNRFFNTSNGSVDIRGYYVGFPYITDVLTVFSKYMGITPFNDGNFGISINNVSGYIINSDWSNKFIKTYWTWIWYDAVNAAVITLNNLTGVITSSSLSTGAITCSSLNAGSGNITTTGNIETTIGAVTSKTFQSVNTNTYRNKIQMENLFISSTIQSLDLRAQYIGLAHPTLTLSAASTYGFLQTFTGGDVGLSINNISGYAWITNGGARQIGSDYSYVGKKTGFTSGYRYSIFQNSGTEIGSISMASTSTVAFNTSSDYRLKQDIVPIKNPLERLMKLQPKNYRFIADALDECCCDCYIDGFIAHEIQEIIPICVSGVKDDPEQMQSIDYSKLTPICVGAIQELNNKVDKMQVLIDSQYDIIKTLITRLENLENK